MLKLASTVFDFSLLVNDFFIPRESTSEKRRKSAKNVQNSNSSLVSKSTSTASSTSSNSFLLFGDSPLQSVQESERNKQELILSERKVYLVLFLSFHNNMF